MKFFILLTILTFSKINSLTLFCQFKYMGYGTLPGTQYLCETTNIVNTPDCLVRNIIGTHSTGKTNNDVTYFEIRGNNTLQFIPRRISHFFPNLVIFSVMSSAFTTLNGDELGYLPFLKVFSVSYSRLETIPSRLFDNTPNLIQIGFGHNQIKRVGHEVFSTLNLLDLDFIGFQNNPCTSRTASSPSEMVALINNLRIECPYYDEQTCPINSAKDDKDMRIMELESEIKELKQKLQDK